MNSFVRVQTVVKALESHFKLFWLEQTGGARDSKIENMIVPFFQFSGFHFRFCCLSFASVLAGFVQKMEHKWQINRRKRSKRKRTTSKTKKINIRNKQHIIKHLFWRPLLLQVSSSWVFNGSKNRGSPSHQVSPAAWAGGTEDYAAASACGNWGTPWWRISAKSAGISLPSKSDACGGRGQGQVEAVPSDVTCHYSAL